MVNEIISVAQKVASQEQHIRALIKNMPQKETIKIQCIRFAGSLVSMAASLLTEVSDSMMPEFDPANTNHILREWGIDELV